MKQITFFYLKNTLFDHRVERKNLFHDSAHFMSWSYVIYPLFSPHFSSSLPLSSSPPPHSNFFEHWPSMNTAIFSPYLQANKREILTDYALPVAVILLSFIGSYIFRDIPGQCSSQYLLTGLLILFSCCFS